MREGSGEGPLTVLHFGNRTPIKGALDLVRGLRDEPNVRLILAGRELEPGFDEQLKREAGSLQLELHGSYDARELRRLARGCDVAAFPSRAFESYGLVVEEALALGLPVWVSDRGALPEVLHRAAHFGSLPGGVVPAESPSAWRAVMRELVADPEKLQDAAARVPARMRTAADTTRDLLEIFSTLTTPSSAS
jgi:glycogen(starch) synthase